MFPVSTWKTRFLLSILLVASVQCRLKSFNMSQISEELSLLPEEECMSTAQLEEAVNAAVLSVDVEGVQKSGVILTACDVNCLRQLFEPFMWSIEHSRDGDFSRHVVIVGLGLPAYVYCDHMRHKHKHHCVLDRRCLPPGQPKELGSMHGEREGYRYGTTWYFLALVQKVMWATEVIKLGKSVLWTDMDIFHFGNPLTFLMKAAPDGDFLIESEYWDKNNIFVGDVCKHRGPDTGRKYPGCGGFIANGGMWLVHPTAAGSLLVEAWAWRLFEDSVVMGKVWTGASWLDQAMFQYIASTNNATIPLYRWDKTQERYINYQNKSRLVEQENIFRVSMRRLMGRNFGECGMLGDNVGFRHYFRLSDGRVDKNYQPTGNPSKEQLVCIMPRRCADRVITQHKNGLPSQTSRRVWMMSWMNFTVDEAQYEKEAKEEGRVLDPDC